MEIVLTFGARATLFKKSVENMALNRACPIPYNLKDTTFSLFLSLANENLSHRFMNLQMFICLSDLRED